MSAGAYVFRDTAGAAVYVGASGDVERRVGQHKNKEWWPEVDARQTEIVTAVDRTAAFAVERDLIRRLQPRHNRRLNGARPQVKRPIHSVLAEVRVTLGVTQEELAERMGRHLGETLTAEDVAVLEAGDVPFMDAELDAIFAAYGLTSDPFRRRAMREAVA